MKKGIFSSIIALMAIFLVTATFIYLRIPVQETTATAEIQTIKNQNFEALMVRDFAERAFSETVYDYIIANRVESYSSACVDSNPADGICDNCMDLNPADGACDCPDVDSDGKCDNCVDISPQNFICDNYCAVYFDSTIESNFASYFNNSAGKFGSCRIVNALIDPLLKSELVNPIDCVGGAGSCLQDAKSVFVSGNYAFVAADAGDSIAFINVASPSNPVVIAQRTFGDPNWPLNDPSDVFVSGNYLFVPVKSSGKILIIDISDPSTPLKPVLFNGGGNSIFVSGNYVYFTSSSVPTAGSFTVFDIINPLNPGAVFMHTQEDNLNSFNALQGASDVFVSDGYMYVTAGGENSLTIADISGLPTIPPVFVSQYADVQSGPLQQANSVFVVGDYAYVTAHNPGSFVIFDVSNKTVDPQIKVTIKDGFSGYNLLAGASDVFVSDGFAYVTADIDNALTIIDVSDPLNPKLFAELSGVGGFNKLAGASSVYVQGSYAYVTAATDNALTIIDISNPADPSILPEIKITGDLSNSGTASTTINIECESQSTFGPKKTVYRKKYSFNKGWASMTAFQTEPPQCKTWVFDKDTADTIMDVCDDPGIGCPP